MYHHNAKSIPNMHVYNKKYDLDMMHMYNNNIFNNYFAHLIDIAFMVNHFWLPVRARNFFVIVATQISSPTAILCTRQCRHSWQNVKQKLVDDVVEFFGDDGRHARNRNKHKVLINCQNIFIKLKYQIKAKANEPCWVG